MTDLPGRLRVMARLTGRDDDADTAAEAAREIERLRLTDAERQAVETAIATLAAFSYPTLPAAAATLRNRLERLK